MWIFRGRDDDEDSDEFESDDYDSDEYETDEEELDSDASASKHDEQVIEEEKSSFELPEEQHVNGHDDEKKSADNEEPETVLEAKEDKKASAEQEPSETETETVADEKESVAEQEPAETVTAVSTNETTDQESEEDAKSEKEESDNEEEEDEATSLQEKESLLALAAEHDRVDILKAILASTSDRDYLLSPTKSPSPLHIAITNGAANATSCLLRMGAHAAPDTWELLDSLNLKPSKREGIRHAFTAEALRCIGSDEVERLQHLLDSGMPLTIDIGGKTLHGWCVEMEATQCELLTRPEQPETVTRSSSTRSIQGDPDSLAALDNRLEELDNLSKALSLCLDNLAEEVSVCHGLLLLGGGASALASHVKSLRLEKETKEIELDKVTDEWNDAQDELAYWLNQTSHAEFDHYRNGQQQPPPVMSRKSSFAAPETPEEEESQRRQLKAQIAASENKVRKLRASIADLSEEAARDLVEVENRGLSGGIKLVRSLREELRELEFELSAAKSGEAACRAGVNLIVAHLESQRKENGTTMTKNNDEKEVGSRSLFDDEEEEAPQEDVLKSETIESGRSEAITVRQPTRGYLPLDLWEIILRIIGFGRVAVKKSAEDLRESTPSAMII